MTNPQDSQWSGPRSATEVNHCFSVNPEYQLCIQIAFQSGYYRNQGEISSLNKDLNNLEHQLVRLLLHNDSSNNTFVFDKRQIVCLEKALNALNDVIVGMNQGLTYDTIIKPKLTGTLLKNKKVKPQGMKIEKRD